MVRRALSVLPPGVFVVGIATAILLPSGGFNPGSVAFADFANPPVDHRIGLRITIAVGTTLIALILAVVARRQGRRLVPGRAT